MRNSALAAGVRRLRSVAATQRRHDESDEQLLRAFTDDHDETAFAALVRRHGTMVAGVCRRVLRHTQDAEDAFQATFLVLARRAAFLRHKAALPSFLHRTAFYLASRANRDAARRHKHEGRAPARPSLDPTGELLWREVQAILDEEIERLPERYRSVFVLCCLESLCRSEVARRLNLKEGTVSSRLTAARAQLQRRLKRRGIELTALLAASALTAESASALPTALVAKTTRGAASPAVAALAAHSLPAVSPGKVKLVMVFLAVALLASGAAFALRETSPQGANTTPLAQPEPAAPPRDTVPVHEIKGRVFGPDAKPKADAKLLLLGEGGKVTPLGVTTAEGQFQVTVPNEPRYRKVFRYLVAQADGTGLDFLELESLKLGKPVELRLVKDNAIRGRIVNTEGKPIAGVRVTVEDIEAYPDNKMDVFLDAYLKLLAGGRGYGTLKQIWGYGGGAGSLFAAKSDADGRFALHGLGAERTARLRLSGAGKADTSLWITNRAGFDPKPYNQAFIDYFTKANGRKDQRWMERCLLTKADFSVVVEAEKTLRGTVTDADSGKGVAGIEVHLTGYYDDMMPPIHLKTKADAEGRYAIRGARKAKRYLIQIPADTTSGYMAGQVWADDSTAYEPVRADIKVKKGVLITGKVIDRATGEAIPGWAAAAPLEGNGFAHKYDLDSSVPRPVAGRVLHSQEMDREGNYRLLIYPGPVLLMGGPNHQILKPLEALRYKPPVADPEAPKYFPAEADAASDGRLAYLGLGGGKGHVEGNFCKVLDIKPGTEVVKQDIVLERASSVTVKIQDVEGRPLAGAWVTGAAPPPYYRTITIDKDSCPIYHVEPGRSRQLIFVEAKRQLAGSITLKGDEKGSLVVKLAPVGSIKGRLLDADGKALGGIAVDLQYRESEADDAHRTLHEKKSVVSDANGDFTYEGVIPRQKCVLTFRQGSKRMQAEGKSADAALAVDSGACHDVGALTLKLVPQRMRR